MKKMQISIFQKVVALCVMAMMSVQLNAQARIELNSGFRGNQISESTLKGFETTFSYNAIDMENVETEFGAFSRLVMSDAVPSGEIGAPSLPVTRKLIAVPFGAKPVVNVVAYTTSDYKLNDYGVERVYPQQPSYSKDTKTEDVVFQYDKKAYRTRAHSNSPEVSMEILGTMRGVQIAALQVEPVSYNPANNTLRVYNDIQLDVDFENAEVETTEKVLLESYSPYFDVVYKQLYNSRAVTDIFDEHPDLYKAPVYMTVVANSMFEEALQPWLEWKTQKGFFINVKYVESNTLASEIQSHVKEQYNSENKPTFLVIVGDSDKVAPSVPSGQETNLVTDLYYGSLDGDYFPDIYYSRMSCETVEELENLINKVLQYEKYTMPDPSYLNNALMIAGVDNWWNPKVGTPSINYATNFFFNQTNGMDKVYKYTNVYTGCYDNINTGVGFVNYTAHGVETGWVDPAFSNADVLKLSNKDKYFWALGNCCLTGNWGYTQSPCLGETMIRAKEKGAWGYIGSCPVTYWYEDYYFVVGATAVYDKMPNVTQTETGVYEMIWEDDVYNVLSAIPFVGNLSVTSARSNAEYENTNGIETLYYWEAYHTIGDGTVMPFRTNPTPNTVSHPDIINMGLDFYTVAAEPSSYVAISKDGVLHGAAEVGIAGVVDVPITPILSDGEATVVVTHPRHIPYIKNVTVAPTEGPYLSVYSVNPESFPVNQECKMTLTVRNVGEESTEGETKVTLSSDSEYITFTDSQATFSSLASKSTIDLNDEFSFVIDKTADDETVIIIDCEIEYDTMKWNNKFLVNVVSPIIEYEDYVWGNSFEPGGTFSVKAKFKNVGRYKATNAVVTATTSSEYVTFKNATASKEVIDIDEVAEFDFEFTVDASCPMTEKFHVDFSLVADNDKTANGSCVLTNVCDVVFTLKDQFGDGWAKSAIEVKYDDGTPTDTLTMFDGDLLAIEKGIALGTKVTVSFIKAKYNSYECSYTIEYKDGELIYDSGKNLKEGLHCEFVTSCIDTTNVNEIEVNNVKFDVYPNPATDVINITSNAPRYEYQMINSLGQVVLEGVSSEDNTISVANMQNGIYFLKLVADGEMKINKIIIQ
ncbi:MAG: T9SS type A sorting domain-containing protein [Lentimicrobiaceae bacterium]|nr:T9SS type A sorting domain-containing protein [Lentimicrobiaceae bacterium]